MGVGRTQPPAVLEKEVRGVEIRWQGPLPGAHGLWVTMAEIHVANNSSVNVPDCSKLEPTRGKMDTQAAAG